MTTKKNNDYKLGEMSSDIKAIRQDIGEMKENQDKYVTKEEFKPYKAILLLIGTAALYAAVDSIVVKLKSIPTSQSINIHERPHDR